MTVSVYFGSSGGQTLSCDVVEAVSRTIPATKAVAAAALNELFKGPAADERRRGLSSLFSPLTSDLLRGVHVESGTAYVDLRRSLLDIHSASSSCGSTMLTTMIERTLKQFPTVSSVRYAVEANPQTFYDFVQQGCPQPPTAGDRCDAAPFR